MSAQSVLEQSKVEFEKAITHLQEEYSRLQVGRANPALVEGIHVEVYGATQPIKAMASISIPDSRTIQIQPWDKSLLAAVEKGIVGSGLNFNPVNDGICVRIAIPPLTEERRKDLVKVVYKLEEEAKIGVRTARHDALNTLRALHTTSEITEDQLSESEGSLQTTVDGYNIKLAEMAAAKEKEVMTV